MKYIKDNKSNIRSTLIFIDMICGAINYILVKKNSIDFSF